MAPAASFSNPVAAAARRCLSTTAARRVVLPKDAQNMRHAKRDPVGPLRAPLVNPADKYQSKADDLHRYGTWLMGCLPKYVQQFSVWKDELCIYISPSGVLPVFSFLKCECIPASCWWAFLPFSRAQSIRSQERHIQTMSSQLTF
jgi:NADH dehydrogenase (ubiquinone) Fe-S protein 3